MGKAKKQEQNYVCDQFQYEIAKTREVQLNSQPKPPYGNTGVQNTNGFDQVDFEEFMFLEQTTKHNKLTVSIDWLEFTIKNNDILVTINDVLGFSVDEFQQLEKGGNGYKSAHLWHNGDVKIFSDGNDNMGCHVVATGSGCKALFNRINFKTLIMSIVGHNGSFTRVDLALDDIGNQFYSVNDVYDELSKGKVVSKWHSATINKEFNISDTEQTTKEILYFGSMKSEIYMRIYNKQKEYNSKVESDKQISYPWTRWEIVLKKQRAQVAIEELFHSDFKLGDIMIGVLSYYMRIAEPSADSNRSRWETSKKWLKFIGSVQQLRLVIFVAERTIEKTKKWISDQVLPSLNLLFQADNSLEWLVWAIMSNGYRLSKKHKEMLIKYWNNMSCPFTPKAVV